MKVHVFSITIHTFIVITDISKLVNLHKMQSLTSTPSIDFFTYAPIAFDGKCANFNHKILFKYRYINSSMQLMHVKISCIHKGIYK